MQVFNINGTNEWIVHYKGAEYRFEAENDRHAYTLARATCELHDLINKE